MMLTETINEENLLKSIRQLNSEQKEKLLSFINSIANSSLESSSISGIVEQIRTEAEQHNLTEEVLSQILSEKYNADSI